MKIHFVFLLMCAAMCASKPIEPHCKCVKTDKQVSLKLISSYQRTKPNPFCNKVEIILTLKDNRKVCIDPEGEFSLFLANLRRKLSQTGAKKNPRTTEPSAEYSPASVKTL
ncbi:growth-regulated alpha protein-like [Periophthalmus magnuspinnatus]|uniref:growth-regulated alpha protein-like n=1 Tax=Periophthalmus magnuspinnatus TaxID=409849 RepID=UPI0024373024|nr:growth-regulated alpha protein-like [Periophthalmus magnuspinnatus]